MLDGELQESARLEHPVDLAQHRVEVGHVHQAHEGDDEVEGLVGKGERGRAGGQVADAERLAALLDCGGVDEALGDVDGGHAGAAAGEQAGVVALAAAQVQAGFAGAVHAAQQRGVVRPGDVDQGVEGDHAIEGVGLERQRGDVGLQQRRLGGVPPGQPEHLPGVSTPTTAKSRLSILATGTPGPQPSSSTRSPGDSRAERVFV